MDNNRGSHITVKLKPVTEVNEVAMEAPARASSPTWPTYMTEISCMPNSKKFDATSGPANNSCFFTSSTISSLTGTCFLDSNDCSWGTWIKADSRPAVCSSKSISCCSYGCWKSYKMAPIPHWRRTKGSAPLPSIKRSSPTFSLMPVVYKATVIVTSPLLKWTYQPTFVLCTNCGNKMVLLADFDRINRFVKNN